MGNILRLPFKKKTIKNRVITSILILIVIPSMIAFFSIMSIYSTRANDAAVESKKQVLSQMNNNINANLKKYSELTMQMYYNSDLINAIGVKEKTVGHISLIGEYLNSCVNSDMYLTSAYVTIDDEIILSDISHQGIEKFFEEYRERIKENNGKIVWIPTQKFISKYGTEDNAFVSARSIRKNNEQIGIVWLFISDRFFGSLYDKSAISNGAANVIISDDHSIVNVLGEGELPETFDHIITGRQGADIVTIDNQRQLVVYSASSENDWIYVNITPESTILKGLQDIQLIIVLIIMLYAVFIVLMAAVLTKHVIKPIESLSTGINEVASGQLETSVVISGDDEISLLSKNFNDMVQKIASLMNEVKAEEEAKNNAKITALSLQISPHFIYNTLNSIKWIAVINKQENIELMLQAMISFLQGVSQNNDFITLKQELNLIDNYLYIQKVRYMNFDVRFAIDPQTLHCKVGKLLLQPIVENAILHGIANESNGLIQVSSYRQDNVLVLTVEDNGKGFDINGLSEKKVDNKPHHIGLNNVKERIALEYGNNYGIEIDSVIDKGTTVVIRLPYICENTTEEFKND